MRGPLVRRARSGQGETDGLANVCTRKAEDDPRVSNLFPEPAGSARDKPYYHSFGNKSHPAAIELAERLVRMAPKGLAKAFFTNSGSEANDSVVKLLWFYNNGRGRPEKKKIISRHRAYHGITVASGSLTGTPWNHAGFDLPLPGFLHVGCPDFYRFGRPGESEEAFATRLASELEDTVLREGPDTIAAFIGEPLMAAGGVFVPPATYWEKVQTVLRRDDVLLVADEVINGFGRTGAPFGCDTYGIRPDMMVVSKQLTSSYQPLAAVLFTDEIYRVVAAHANAVGSFAHGFTTSGHPVAVAVALENLNIIEERGLMRRAAELSPLFLERLHGFATHPLVGNTRGAGLVGAVDLVADKAAKRFFDPVGRVGTHVNERCHEHGLIIRSIGDIIAFCPPLIIEPAEIEDMFDRFAHALDDTLAWIERGALLQAA